MEMKARIGQKNNKLEESTMGIEKEFPIKNLVYSNKNFFKKEYKFKENSSNTLHPTDGTLVIIIIIIYLILFI